MTFQLRVRGAKDIERRLKQIVPRLRKQVLTKAARVAMRPIMQAAKSRAPRLTGQLKKAIRMRAMKKSRVRVGIYVAGAEQWFQGDQFYLAFQEFGWHIGKRSNKLRSRGKWSGIGGADDTRRFRDGKHFIEQAFDAGKQQALDTFTSEVRHNLHQAITTGGIK